MYYANIISTDLQTGCGGSESEVNYLTKKKIVTIDADHRPRKRSILPESWSIPRNAGAMPDSRPIDRGLTGQKKPKRKKRRR